MFLIDIFQSLGSENLVFCNTSCLSRKKRGRKEKKLSTRESLFEILKRDIRDFSISKAEYFFIFS